MEALHKLYIDSMWGQGFAYCKRHGFYDRGRKEEIDKYLASIEDPIERMLESISASAYTCPGCRESLLASLASVGRIPEEQRQYENFREGEVLYELAAERDLTPVRQQKIKR